MGNSESVQSSLKYGHRLIKSKSKGGKSIKNIKSKKSKKNNSNLPFTKSPRLNICTKYVEVGCAKCGNDIECYSETDRETIDSILQSDWFCLPSGNGPNGKTCANQPCGNNGGNYIVRNRRKILSALKLQNARTEKRCLILLGIRFVLMFCLATLTLSLIAAKMINVTLAQIPVLIAVAMALTIAVVQANQ